MKVHDELHTLKMELMKSKQQEREEIFKKAQQENRDFTEIETLTLRVIQLEINTLL